MIAHQPATKRMRKIRKDGVIPRFEYEQRAIEFAKYGLDLPQTKLLPIQVQAIREAVETRNRLRKEINEKYSNKALADAFCVHERTIEKVIAYVTHFRGDYLVRNK